MTASYLSMSLVLDGKWRGVLDTMGVMLVEAIVLEEMEAREMRREEGRRGRVLKRFSR